MIICSTRCKVLNAIHWNDSLSLRVVLTAVHCRSLQKLCSFLTLLSCRSSSSSPPAPVSLLRDYNVGSRLQSVIIAMLTRLQAFKLQTAPMCAFLLWITPKNLQDACQKKNYIDWKRVRKWMEDGTPHGFFGTSPVLQRFAILIQDLSLSGGG